MKINFNEVMKKVFRDVRISEISIETMYGYMNYHLELLHTALKEDNHNEVMFQRGQLEKVRQRLLELEYFNFMEGK